MLLIFPSGTLKHQAFLKAVEYYHERATVLLEPRIGMCGKVRNTDKDHDIKEKGRGLRNHLVLYPQEKQDKLPLDRSTINWWQELLNIISMWKQMQIYIKKAA